LNLARKLTYAIGGLLVLTALVLVSLAKLSSVVTVYRCPGNYALPGGPTAGELYVRLEEFRPWILWRDSDGNMQIEVRRADTVTFDFFDRIDNNGNNLFILADGKAAGMFSRLSNILSINTSLGFFDGKCAKT